MQYYRIKINDVDFYVLTLKDKSNTLLNKKEQVAESIL